MPCNGTEPCRLDPLHSWQTGRMAYELRLVCMWPNCLWKQSKFSCFSKIEFQLFQSLPWPHAQGLGTLYSDNVLCHGVSEMTRFALGRQDGWHVQLSFLRVGKTNFGINEIQFFRENWTSIFPRLAQLKFACYYDTPHLYRSIKIMHSGSKMHPQVMKWCPHLVALGAAWQYRFPVKYPQVFHLL